ncbi:MULTISPECIES: transporter substrate-binding domain-containing protein [unclassified Butyrivibrio]|uniref:transporter substrate-binding domain-containing protein n=1 Tax=unclassified Butyrivibrio TaxID=2639466 RepID=UPI00047C3316|nr:MULTISPECIES: transporter substrate-binding domain-containing protein [unclassified Butyrivibrio]
MSRLVRILIVTTLLISITACSSPKAVIGEDAHLKYDNLNVIDINLTEEEYGIGVDKNQPELLNQINAFIKECEANGKFEEICSHYEGGEPVPVESVERNNTKDQLIVATTGDFAPFDYNIADKSYGIDKEFVAALAEYLGKELVLEYINFDIMFMTVAQHKADICIAGITINDARKKYVDFSDPYYHAGQIIVTTDKCTLFDNVKNAAEIEEVLNNPDNNLTVAVENMTTGHYYCEGNSDFGYAGFPVTTVPLATLDDCLEELEGGGVDIVIGDAAVLKYIIDK